jgi:hypothetical protein
VLRTDALSFVAAAIPAAADFLASHAARLSDKLLLLPPHRLLLLLPRLLLLSAEAHSVFLAASQAGSV